VTHRFLRRGEILSETQPAYARGHPSRGIEPVHDMSPVPCRERFENLLRFRILLQCHAEISKHSRFARFAIDPERHADFIARMGPRGLSQRGVKLHAIPPAGIKVTRAWCPFTVAKTGIYFARNELLFLLERVPPLDLCSHCQPRTLSSANASLRPAHAHAASSAVYRSSPQTVAPT